MNAIKTLPDPITSHGPQTRHVELSQFHAGQIVTPVVRAWHKGKGYLVQLCWHDSSDQTYSEPEEYVGDLWACVKWLSQRGVRGADIDAA